ncbi:TPA: hypothetical protein HA241_06140 [Candidatus Woesearchaeota archaeon]|nr:hypothetical protein [Candidatus Woesearchaeota archaeon]
MGSNQNEIEQGKAAAVLSYLLVGIIWFFADEKMRKNRFVAFHVKQALVLLVISVAVSIVFAILGSILGLFFLMMGGFFFIFWIGRIINLLVFALALWGIISAAQGKEQELPVIGSFAKKFTL